MKFDSIRRRPRPTGSSRPVSTPLSASVVYAAETPDALDAIYEGRDAGWTYSREGHPNAAVVAEMIDSLEGARDGVMTGSGMAAVTAAILGAVSAGEHIVAGNQLYGRSLRLLTEQLPRLGIGATLADSTDAAAVVAAIRPETRLILVEVISNPTIRLTDMEGVLAAAKNAGVPVAVDNTFTTPAAYRPFEHGADIVIHSVTKLLAGHSDAMLGYVAARDPGIRERIVDAAVTMGLTPSPFDCWMAERGLYSFDLRYARAESNAAALADHLAELPGVSRVLHPMRPDHPDRGRAAGLLGGRGGNMLSFEVGGGRAAANRLAAGEGMIFAPTLGDVATTLSHPASSSHRGLTPEDRAAIGVTEGFFRVSVGIEDIDILKSEFAATVSAAVG